MKDRDNTGVSGPKCAFLPAGHRPDLEQAAREAGAVIVEPGEAEALIWTHSSGDPADMRAAVDENPHLRWVHLGPAGIEKYVPYLDADRMWTCGKGVFARPVAELALTLMLAGFRRIHRYARASSWGDLDGITLFGSHVTILGGGGIAETLADLLVLFEAEVTVVRNRIQPIPNVAHVVGADGLDAELERADVVVVALALTPATERIIDADALGRMQEHAWLVNVARGRHVDTDALVEALTARSIGGAALDVTDPEPLPDGHPLWTMPNALITPHTANPRSIGGALVAQRLRENVRRFGTGEALLGPIDVTLGY
ncbi:MAG: D-isomer specific 2-hydroxyacid dehydrogenase family protein [Acidimicrobiia bacterium]